MLGEYSSATDVFSAEQQLQIAASPQLGRALSSFLPLVSTAGIVVANGRRLPATCPPSGAHLGLLTAGAIKELLRWILPVGRRGQVPRVDEEALMGRAIRTRPVLLAHASRGLPRLVAELLVGPLAQVVPADPTGVGLSAAQAMCDTTDARRLWPYITQMLVVLLPALLQYAAGEELLPSDLMAGVVAKLERDVRALSMDPSAAGEGGMMDRCRVFLADIIDLGRVPSSSHLAVSPGEGLAISYSMTQQAVRGMQQSGDACSGCCRGRDEVEAEGQALKACSGCRRAWYCSLDCQRSAWPGHRQACKAARAEKGGGGKK